jgi:molybdopterin-guanine dinucleotide biosynthesis protein A
VSALTPSSAVAAVILAGGQSTRMGQPKALLPYRGQPLLEHLVAQLKPQVAQVLIAGCPQADLYSSLSIPVIDDVMKDAGPLGGICSAMQTLASSKKEAHSCCEYLLVVPCDGIRLPDAFMEGMFNALESGRHELVFAKDSQREQPLYSMWQLSLLPDLQHYLSSGGRKVIDWIRMRDYAVVDFSAGNFCFSNLNTPQDWRDFVSTHE